MIRPLAGLCRFVDQTAQHQPVELLSCVPGRDAGERDLHPSRTEAIRKSLSSVQKGNKQKTLKTEKMATSLSFKKPKNLYFP